jgi:hypothetical protein
MIYPRNQDDYKAKSKAKPRRPVFKQSMPEFLDTMQRTNGRNFYFKDQQCDRDRKYSVAKCFSLACSLLSAMVGGLMKVNAFSLPQDSLKKK